MANVGIPYLESDESLVLTTDRVSVNTVQYDVLLTTRYLILVDVRYAQFQPKMIPLLTIQSVKGGKTANGELVITLFFEDTGSIDKPESMVLLFSQQPGEQRKSERDEWLKTLMGLIVSLRQEISYDSTPADPEIGIRPSMRTSNAPDIPRPFKKVVDSRPAQIELIIIPDKPESPVFSEQNQELPEISFHGEESESAITPASCATEETLGSSQKVSVPEDAPLPPIPVIGELQGDSEDGSGSPDTLSPQIPGFKEIPCASPEVSGSPDTLQLPEVPIIVESTRIRNEESEFQETITLVTVYEEIPGTAEADAKAQKSATVSLLAAVKSLSSPQGRAGLPDTGMTPLPSFEETPGTKNEVTGSPATLLPPEVPDIVASSFIQENKAEPILPPDTSTTGKKSGASHKDAVSPDLPTSPEPVTIASPVDPDHDSPLSEPVLPEAGEGDASVQQPDPEAIPQTPGSPPPSAGPGSRWSTFIAVAAIILIILGIGGVVIFYPLYPTTPVVEPTPLPTPTIQPTPLPTPLIIPTTGVWVRVGYPRTYSGWVGTTGSMREVTGSGVQIFRIPENESTVHVQMQKLDNSGDTLTVEVYRNGEVISSRTVSVPMGSVELLIDAKTGNPPGMTPVVTPTGNKTASNVGRIMYF